MKTIILQSLAHSINAYLDLDPESQPRLAKLYGKIITIEFLPLLFSFQCRFTEKGITIQNDDPTVIPNATLRGTPLQMLGVLLEKDNRQHFFANDVVIEGDAEFGQEVVELFDRMQIDWEEHLSHVVGDIPAYHASQLTKQIASWLGTIKESFSHDINEYIHEEAKWMPSDEALQDFFAEIDTLRMDTDRMEARINHLLLKNKETQ